ncbi:hypothetical protein F5883DRAFT_130953 [Diaporthe sp. PMI_573]|nr:hypothetical protein F5883DRAFT_130953 [Diaporthaceae sp. PMI_573]
MAIPQLFPSPRATLTPPVSLIPGIGFTGRLSIPRRLDCLRSNRNISCYMHMYMNVGGDRISPESHTNPDSILSYVTPPTKLKVAVIGPKGQCGSCVVDELLFRSHSVVGISRNPPSKWAVEREYRLHAVDLNDTDRFAQALSQEFDTIVNAY